MVAVACQQVLCSMETDEEIVRLQFGGKNTVYLPDSVPEPLERYVTPSADV